MTIRIYQIEDKDDKGLRDLSHATIAGHDVIFRHYGKAKTFLKEVKKGSLAVPEFLLIDICLGTDTNAGWNILNKVNEMSAYDSTKKIALTDSAKRIHKEWRQRGGSASLPNKDESTVIRFILDRYKDELVKDVNDTRFFQKVTMIEEESLFWWADTIWPLTGKEFRFMKRLTYDYYGRAMKEEDYRRDENLANSKDTGYYSTLKSRVVKKMGIPSFRSGDRNNHDHGIMTLEGGGGYKWFLGDSQTVPSRDELITLGMLPPKKT